MNIEPSYDTSFEQGLFGIFEPPLAAGGTTFNLTMSFADSNAEDPLMAEYSIPVTVI